MKKTFCLSLWMLNAFCLLLNAENISIQSDPFGYSEQYSDNESHLQYLFARYYDVKMLRFVTQDSVDLLNRYNYAGDNPIMNEDPSGHIPQWIGYLLGGMGTTGSGAAAKYANTKLAAASGILGLTSIASEAGANHSNNTISSSLNIVAMATGGVSLLMDGIDLAFYRKSVSDAEMLEEPIQSNLSNFPIPAFSASIHTPNGYTTKKITNGLANASRLLRAAATPEELASGEMMVLAITPSKVHYGAYDEIEDAAGWRDSYHFTNGEDNQSTLGFIKEQRHNGSMDRYMQMGIPFPKQTYSRLVLEPAKKIRFSFDINHDGSKGTYDCFSFYTKWVNNRLTSWW